MTPLAAAAVPSPPNSTCPAAVLVGDGGCCFDVVVRDFANNPIAGASVVVDMGSCAVTFCPSQPHSGNSVSAITNPMGIAHFCICASITGSCTAPIYADGVLLCTVPVNNCNTCSNDVPLTMSYQGVLTDASGNIPSDGPHNITFAIYDDPTLAGSHLLWTENHVDVPVTRGGFSRILGLEGTPAVPLTIPFDKQYFLGLSVAASPGTPGPELSPRVALTSSPYSLIARSVAECSIIDASIAPGQVVKGLNGLHDAVTLVGGANVTITPSGQTLTISASGTGGIGGSGTTNYLPKFTAGTTLGNSNVYESGGRVGIGTTTPTTSLDVAGGTKLGAGAPAIKMKRLTGTTAGTQNGQVSIAHGLADSKILAVEVLVEYAANAFVPASHTITAGYEFGWTAGLGVITVANKNGNSASILSRPMRILVTYEE